MFISWIPAAMRPVLLMSAVLLLAGCAASAGSNAAFLLEQDYQRMPDPELIAYDQELSEEIAHSSGAGPGSTSVGFGVGSWGSHTGFGVGVEQALGGSNGGAPVALRDRRDAVRIEMRRRGLLPPAGGGQ